MSSEGTCKPRSVFIPVGVDLGHSRADVPASYNREPSGNRKGTFSTDFQMQVQKYFKDTNKFFYSFSPSVQYRKDFDQPQTFVTVSLGYGRFIDATPLRKAVRIEEFLYRE
mgnify:CR=1 FL=1